MLITTTNTVEGKNIKEYKTIVFGEQVEMKIGLVVLGKYEELINEGRRKAINKMIKQAEDLGANAIIGTKIDVTPIGDSSYLVVTASGTAVVTE